MELWNTERRAGYINIIIAVYWSDARHFRQGTSFRKIGGLGSIRWERRCVGNFRHEYATREPHVIIVCVLFSVRDRPAMLEREYSELQQEVAVKNGCDPVVILGATLTRIVDVLTHLVYAQRFAPLD